MLQTTENQLKPQHMAFRHRQQINNALYNNGFDITTSNGLIYKEYAEFPYLIPFENSPIDIRLDIDYDWYNNLEYIGIADTIVYCKQYTSTDIQTLANLYIHMLKNNIQKIPKSLESLDDYTIKPGRLADVISDYLNKEKRNVTNFHKSTKS